MTDRNETVPPAPLGQVERGVVQPRVTDAPETVWLVYGDLDRDSTHRECRDSGEVTWCEDAQFAADVRYLRADLLHQEARAIAAASDDWRQQAAALLERQAKELDYLRACRENRAPAWVPCRVLLEGPVRGDYPIGHTTLAEAGEHDCESNRYGAISVRATNGQMLGVKPAEFEPLEWRKNDGAQRTG